MSLRLKWRVKALAITSRRRARDSSDSEKAYKVPWNIMSLKPATLILDVNRSKAQAQSLEEHKNNSAGLIVQWIRGLPKSGLRIVSSKPLHSF